MSERKFGQILLGSSAIGPRGPAVRLIPNRRGLYCVFVAETTMLYTALGLAGLGIGLAIAIKLRVEVQGYLWDRQYRIHLDQFSTISELYLYIFH